MGFLKKIFGSHSDHELKRLYPIADKIEAMSDEYAALTDEQLRAKTDEFKQRYADGESLDDLLPEAFATAREAAWRVLGMKPFRVQLIGGIVLHQGRIAEMKTGEGKTLVAVLPAYLNALTGEGVHIVTVNDYLARRDSEWMGKVYRFLGLSVGLIVHDMSSAERQQAYAADITYGTNNEMGFDYLRDNMAIYKSQMVQRGHAFAIVDEVDSILIDEARTPLIISGQGDESTDLYRQASKICEKGLRYDLTVPFARYVVQHQGEIVLPFKRYQIQPVWRADRPQKGRYREFYQCDVDVVGSRSLLNEVELVEIVERVFRKLGIAVTLKMNNRKILYGIAETIGHADKMIDITVAIDKLEKIGIDNVKAELRERGIDDAAIDRLQPILELRGDNRRKLSALRDVLSGSETGLKGVEELETVFGYVERLGIALAVELDLSLARGLNYYTGAIFEVKANDYAIGSICGGGRYDDLTGIFGMPDTSGVGISFGADRIYDVMVGLELFPEEVNFSTKVLFVNLGADEEAASLGLLRALRDAGVAAEIYPEKGKMKKQMEYANRRSIPYVAIVGSDELARQTVTLKDMRTGEQRQVPFAELAASLQ